MKDEKDDAAKLAEAYALLRECRHYLETTAAGLMSEVSLLLERVDAVLGDRPHG